jgi:redox-sensitive bicupin YhaK (pirin superfamily)
MSAGTGVRHSEFNASPTEPVHFVQIWIEPDAADQPPRYGQKRFDDAAKAGRLALVASGSGADGSIPIQADVNLYASLLKPEESTTLSISPGRHLWVQALKGALEVNGNRLFPGDGLAASRETEFRFEAGAESPAEFLVFDLV